MAGCTEREVVGEVYVPVRLRRRQVGQALRVMVPLSTPLLLKVKTTGGQLVVFSATPHSLLRAVGGDTHGPVESHHHPRHRLCQDYFRFAREPTMLRNLRQRQPRLDTFQILSGAEPIPMLALSSGRDLKA
jgi:hypothetical protein